MTWAGWLAAALAASAAAVATASGPATGRLRAVVPGGRAGSGAGAGGGDGGDRRAAGRGIAAVPPDGPAIVAVLVVTAVLAVPVHEPGLAATLGAVGAALVVARRRSRRAGGDAAVRRAAGGVFAALAAELRAGRPLAAALAATAADAPPRLAGRIAAAARAAGHGAETPPSLLAPGDPVAIAVLRPLAAALVAAPTGAALAGVVDRVARAARADQRLRDTLDAELAGPRTSGALLAALPIVGVLLGAGIGAHPVHLLFHTLAGAGCLFAGALLDVAGLCWARRIAASAVGR